MCTRLGPGCYHKRSQTCEQTSFDWVYGVIGISYQATAWHMSPSSGHEWKNKIQYRVVFFLDGREREDAAPSRCPLRTHA
ncbi:hypothetical protein JOQ06_017247 [Pogonophryne albipinna]|uniref:Uncharacterized protein n=1 Tax=Pogonophryne albipinna TaxID=1090488 RepID=A0AAD6FJH0_9TELE|nr:hypothetical protein JOQ06_017247 [Pogonophryne albipinna]